MRMQTSAGKMGFQEEKQIVRQLHAEIDSAGEDGIGAVLSRFHASDALWRGYHPFNEQTGPGAIAEAFWRPLKRAFTALTRRYDVFFAGRNEIDGFQSTWVVSMGHLMGLLDKPWLGIEPTGKMAFLRYSEFNRIENGRITESAMFFDVPHLMMQCGLSPFPGQRAAHLVQPGPATHDGLLFEDRPAAEGETTLSAINAMINDLGTWQSGLPLEEELARTWDDDMIWWGPAGIGATYTIERYAKQHSEPFRASFSERAKTNHICRMAEGAYGGFFGWPNFTAKLERDFMGIPADGKSAEFRVIDIYRQSGGKLAENWIFIDMPHFARQHGVQLIPDETLG